MGVGIYFHCTSRFLESLYLELFRMSDFNQSISRTGLPTDNATDGAGKDLISGNRKSRDPLDDENDEHMTDSQKKAKQDLRERRARLDGEQDNKKGGSLKIHINLDLDVEVHLTARVKGDITIGLL